MPGALARAFFEHREQVDAQWRFDRLADLPFLEAEGGRAERLGHRTVTLDPAQIASLLPAGSLRILARRIGKGLLPADDAFANLPALGQSGLSSRLAGRSVRFRRQFPENLGHAKLRAVELATVLLEVFFQVFGGDVPLAVFLPGEVPGHQPTHLFQRQPNRRAVIGQRPLLGLELLLETGQGQIDVRFAGRHPGLRQGQQHQLPVDQFLPGGLKQLLPLGGLDGHAAQGLTHLVLDLRRVDWLAAYPRHHAVPGRGGIGGPADLHQARTRQDQAEGRDQPSFAAHASGRLGYNARMETTGVHLLLDLLAAYGVRYVFGNPGTTEMPLNDALVGDPRFQYILGLQEVPVLAMADGYAMASRQVAVVNVHISCGLGNAMGMLYNAWREGTPLLVTAGQQDRRLLFEEPILWGQMVEVVRPWTKWACEVSRIENLPSAVRRAVQTALTPPTGPVFLSLPVDLQMERVPDHPLPDAGPHTASAGHPWAVVPPPLDVQVRPPAGAIRRAAALLAAAKNPAILAGSRVTERNAMQELVRVAELLGAPVLTESGTTHGRLAFPSDHPLNGQGLPLWSPEVRQRLAEYDALLVVGMDLFRQYIYYEPARPIPEHCRLVQIDEDPWQLNKNYLLDVAVLGHTQMALAELAEQLAPLLAPQREAIAMRTARHAEKHAAAKEALRQQLAAEAPLRPMTALTLMGTLARILPQDVAVIEEAVTTTNTVFERLGALQNTTGYFGHRGWALGWGLGVALGVKLAWPQRPVLALLGEGAAAYGIQGLWSAARYRIPAVFVICNNAQYQILKLCGRGLGLPQAQAGRFEGVDLVGPELDYLALARGFGVEAHRVTEPEELADRVATALRGDQPLLLDVPIARQLPGRLNYG